MNQSDIANNIDTVNESNISRRKWDMYITDHSKVS